MICDKAPLYHVSMARDSMKPGIAAIRLVIVAVLLLSTLPLQVASADDSPSIQLTITPEQTIYDVSGNVSRQENVTFSALGINLNEANIYKIRVAVHEEYQTYGEDGYRLLSTTFDLTSSINLNFSGIGAHEWVNDTNYTILLQLQERPADEDQYETIFNATFNFTVGETPKIEPDPTLENVGITCDEDWKITQNDTRLQADDSSFVLNCSAQNNNTVRVLSQLQIMGYPTPDIDAGIEFQVTSETPSIDGNGSTMNFTLRPLQWNLSMIIPNGSVSIQINISAIGWQSNHTIVEINYTIAQEIDDSSSEPVIILGCMDWAATNFNPNATADDGSCEYPEPTPPDCPMCNFTYQIPSQVSVDTPATFSADATLTEGWDYYGGASISWGFDGIIVDGFEVEHTYTSVPAGGTTNVTYCVQFTNGPESCQEETITVNLSLAGYISHSSQLEPSTSDAFGAVHLTIEVWGGLAPYSYEWQFGDGTTSTNQSFVHEFFETGIHNVTVEILDARGDYINLNAQIDIIDSDVNKGDGTNIDEIQELPIKPNAFGIVFTSGGVLFLSTLMYSNGKKKREKILKKGQLLAQKSSSLSADSYWDDSIK